MDEATVGAMQCLAIKDLRSTLRLELSERHIFQLSSSGASVAPAPVVRKIEAPAFPIHSMLVFICFSLSFVR